MSCLDAEGLASKEREELQTIPDVLTVPADGLDDLLVKPKHQIALEDALRMPDPCRETRCLMLDA